MRVWWLVVYQIGSLATWIVLTFFDGFNYNWWNWITVVTINPFLAEIWPIYWLLVLPLTHYVIDPLSGGRHWLGMLELVGVIVAYYWIVGRRARRR